MKFLLIFMIKRYPFLHKLDNLCIDLKHKTVEYEIKEKQESVLKFYSGKSTTYKLQDETVEKFNDIISNRSNEETDVTQCIQTMMESQSTQMNLKISNSQMEMKSLLNDQNQDLLDLKQMIRELLKRNVD